MIVRHELTFLFYTEERAGGGSDVMLYERSDYGVHRIIAVIDARNMRAHRLALRVGFQKLESLSTVFRGEPCIEYVWVLSKAGTTS